MTILAALVAPLLRSVCAARARRFARALDAVEVAQNATLHRIVHACANTEYARAHGLRRDDDADAFRRKLPIAGYVTVAPFIERQAHYPAAAALSPGRVQCFEPTSGSGGAVKSIPYNSALLGAFRSLFAIWAHDLLRHRLRLRSGRTFISVSPTLGAAPRGMADDRGYLGPLQRALIGRFLLTASFADTHDPDAFRRQLAIDLASCADLEIVSVWNPGYLLVLMDYLEQRDPAVLKALPAHRRRLFDRDAPWAALWPNLQLLSCWTGAAAALPARQLAQRLPQAHLQGKGLLATEAPITVPLEAAQGAVPLLDEVFLEFERADGDLFLLHELDIGAEYALVVTQPGGLLRYRLGDRVRVTGRYRDAPLLEFVGRADAVADLVGEKLHEDFVDETLRALLDEASFITLLPVLPAQGRPYYACLTDAPPDRDLADRIDRALQRALRYREARALGQLDGLRLVAHPDMRQRVHDHLAAEGIKLGDIKERRLVTRLETARSLYAAVAATP